MTTHMHRRIFLKQTGLGAAGLWLAGLSPALGRGLSPNEKLNIGMVGVANQANYDLTNVASENIVALCDVDEKFLAAAAARFPRAKTHTDFRRLLDQKDIDAVVVATPDHTHAVATVAALKSGRHVYCEKPLTHTISECRVVMDTARKMKRATQLGTQIHAGANYRRVVELIQKGAVGEVREVHVWVNATYGGKPRPSGSPPVPEGLHYDLWLGPAAYQPYSPEFLPAKWRNWWVFGGGSLADFGCHFMDLPHWALGLGTASSAEVIEGPPLDADEVPAWLVAAYDYPAREAQPAVRLTWYHGGRQPSPDLLPTELAGKWKNGVIFVGRSGKLLADYTRHVFLPAREGFVPPAPFIPDSIGHHAEWIRACKTGEPTTCNFDYSGTLTETVLLGNVAYRAGMKIDWDCKNLRARNCPAAAEFIHHRYRAGWML